jgi:hypothetical protein
MTRPTTKSALLSQAQDNFSRLFALIAPLSEQERALPGVNDVWAVKDVLAHLYAWHRLFLTWYEEGMQGQKPPMPAPGYSWKTTPALNESIFQKYREEPEPRLRTLLEETHQEILALLEGHSEEEIFTKKLYAWTGTTSLGSYAISATASHYHWAYELIRKWVRQRLSPANLD